MMSPSGLLRPLMWWQSYRQGTLTINMSRGGELHGRRHHESPQILRGMLEIHWTALKVIVMWRDFLAALCRTTSAALVQGKARGGEPPVHKLLAQRDLASWRESEMCVTCTNGLCQICSRCK